MGCPLAITTPYAAQPVAYTYDTLGNRASLEYPDGKAVAKYAKSASRLADWMEKNIPEGLTVFAFPTQHQRKLRTLNPIERLSREIRRRTAVVGIFSNEAACLRLISALLMEYDPVAPVPFSHKLTD